MNFKKLKKLHIIIIGSFLCVAAGAALFFLVIKPQQVALQAVQKRLDDAVAAGGTPAAKANAERKLADTIAKVNAEKENFSNQMSRRMPNLSFARRDTGMLALWNEQIRTLGPLLESYARDNNVKVLNANFGIQAPPSNPNDAVFDQDVLVFPLGTIQVMGDFRSLMNNIRRWNNCRRLVMVTEPTLAGVSPTLIVNYKLTCYIFPMEKGGPKIPMAGENQGGAGQPGAPGMPPAAGMPPPPDMQPAPGA